MQRLADRRNLRITVEDEKPIHLVELHRLAAHGLLHAAEVTLRLHQRECQHQTGKAGDRRYRGAGDLRIRVADMAEQEQTQQRRQSENERQHGTEQGGDTEIRQTVEKSDHQSAPCSRCAMASAGLIPRHHPVKSRVPGCMATEL